MRRNFAFEAKKSFEGQNVSNHSMGVAIGEDRWSLGLFLFFFLPFFLLAFDGPALAFPSIINYHIWGGGKHIFAPVS